MVEPGSREKETGAEGKLSEGDRALSVMELLSKVDLLLLRQIANGWTRWARPLERQPTRRLFSRASAATADVQEETTVIHC